MKNQELFFQNKWNRIELQLLRSYFQKKKSSIVADKIDNEKIWNNYEKVLNLINKNKNGKK
jgi:hypothetical protein